MFVYSIIMFICAILFGVLSILIYRGRTDLIHDYHQNKVTDKESYGKAFGKALSVLSVAPAVSGVIGLLGDTDQIAFIATAVLLAGLGVGIACILVVQQKYNKGLF